MNAIGDVHDALEAALAANSGTGQDDAIKIVIEEINSSTGPTGGWLDSPKAICAEIVARLNRATGPVPTAEPPSQPLIEQLEFYANPKNWSERNQYRAKDDCGDLGPTICGWLDAQEALKKYRAQPASSGVGDALDKLNAFAEQGFRFCGDVN